MRTIVLYAIQRLRAIGKVARELGGRHHVYIGIDPEHAREMELALVKRDSHDGAHIFDTCVIHGRGSAQLIHHEQCTATACGRAYCAQLHPFGYIPDEGACTHTMLNPHVATVPCTCAHIFDTKW